MLKKKKAKVVHGVWIRPSVLMKDVLPVIFFIVILGSGLIVLSYLTPPNESDTLSIDEQLSLFVDGVFVRMGEGGCVGAYKYYTGTSFTYDLEQFKEEYGKKHDPDPHPLDAKSLSPPVVLSLAHPIGYDCKDAFMAGLCLSAYYPHVDCVPYFEVKNGEQHVGLHCNEIRVYTIDNVTMQLVTFGDL